MTDYYTASKAEVELLAQKDEEYITSIQSYFQNIAELLPLRYKKTLYQNNKKLIKNASVIVYYMNSFFKNNPTLAETYTSIKPSKIQNLLHMIYLLFMNTNLYSKARMLYPNWIKRLNNLLKIVFNLYDMKIFQRLSTSDYNRTYTTINDPFNTIGKLMLIKLCFVQSFNHFIKPRVFSKPQSQIENKEVVYLNQECLLCYNEDIINPALANCGHVFCYECYVKWTSKSLNCPLCRVYTHPREIILLRN